MSPIWVLAAMVSTWMGWALFSDGPLAYYMAAGALLALLSYLLKDRGGAWVPVAWYGVSIGSLVFTCGGLYGAEADGYSFLCDKGTGLPVSTFTGLGAVIAARAIYRKQRHATTTPH
jgi:hypothetical protein